MPPPRPEVGRLLADGQLYTPRRLTGACILLLPHTRPLPASTAWALLRAARPVGRGRRRPACLHGVHARCRCRCHRVRQPSPSTRSPPIPCPHLPVRVLASSSVQPAQPHVCSACSQTGQCCAVSSPATSAQALAQPCMLLRACSSAAMRGAIRRLPAVPPVVQCIVRRA